MLKIEAPASSEPAPVAERPRFSCLRLDADGVVRLVVRGELDIASAPELESALRRAGPGGPVVLDLRGLTFVDCGGLHAILAADDRAHLAGGRLVVVRGPVDFERLLGLVGIRSDLEVVDRLPSDFLPVIA